jgi:putative transposase
MKDTHHSRLDHQSPDWVNDPVYFITICAKERVSHQLCRESGKEIIRSIKIYHEKRRWYCHLGLLMPDHVHFLLSFSNQVIYPNVVGDWKRWINRHHGIIWQENFFEHRLRDEESYSQKADYILHNPVRAGLIEGWRDWPHYFMAP